MRYIVMHKTDPRWEAGQLPSKELIARVGKLIGEFQKAGKFLNGDGLRSSALGARLRSQDGKRTVTPGPFDGNGALPARLATFRARSLDEAVEVASRFAAILGDGEIDVRPVTEAWDIGIVPKPEGVAPLRFMAVQRAEAADEAGKPLPADKAAALKRLLEELKQAGMLLYAEALEPSSKARRLQKPAGGKLVVRDGPFAETKELIAGFTMIEAASLDEATQFAERYIEDVEATEVDVRGAHALV